MSNSTKKLSHTALHAQVTHVHMGACECTRTYVRAHAHTLILTHHPSGTLSAKPHPSLSLLLVALILVLVSRSYCNKLQQTWRLKIALTVSRFQEPGI